MIAATVLECGASPRRSLDRTACDFRTATWGQSSPRKWKSARGAKSGAFSLRFKLWPLRLAVFTIDLVGYPFGATFSLGTSFSCCFVCKHFVTSMVRWPASAPLTRDFSLFRKPLPLFGRSRTPFTSPSPNGYRGNFSEAWSHPGAPEVYTPNGGKGVCGNRTPHNPCLCSQLSQNDNRGTAKIHIQQANKVAMSRTPEPVFLDALHGSLPDVPSDPYFIAIFDANKL